MLDGGQSEAALAQAEKLAKDWSERGLANWAGRADGLVTKIKSRLAELVAAKLEEEAAVEFAGYLTRLRRIGSLAKTTDKQLLRLDDQLAKMIAGYEGTAITPKASQQLIALRAEAKRRAAERARKKAAIDAAEDELDVIKLTINALMKKYEFDSCFRLIRDFEAKHRIEFARLAARAVRAQLEDQGKKILREADRKVSYHLARKQFEEARQSLGEFRRTVRYAALTAGFDKIAGRIAETQRGWKLAAEAERVAGDRRRLDAIGPRVSEYERARKYSDAARELRAVAATMKTSSLRTRALQLALVYSKSQAALAGLVAHVKAKKSASRVTAVFIVSGEEKEGVAAGGDDKGLEFEVGRGIFMRKNFDKLPSPELLAFFDALPLSGSGKLELAALAWSLGESAAARKLAAGASRRGADAELFKALQVMFGRPR